MFSHNRLHVVAIRVNILITCTDSAASEKEVLGPVHVHNYAMTTSLLIRS